jgi:hypothetical protein
VNAIHAWHIHLQVFNKNAQFKPHTDSGAGAGQSCSLIVGLGDYSGGELAVEGEVHTIRYTPVEFDGWKQVRTNRLLS